MPLLPWHSPCQLADAQSLPLLADVLPQKATSPFSLILPNKKKNVPGYKKLQSML